MKQHPFDVVPDTAGETRPFLTPRGLTGAADGFAKTALCIAGLRGKMDYADQVDAWRSSRQGYQRVTNTGGSPIKGPPYSVKLPRGKTVLEDTVEAKRLPAPKEARHVPH